MSNFRNNPNLVTLTDLKTVVIYFTRKKQIQNNVNIQKKTLVAAYI